MFAVDGLPRGPSVTLNIDRQKASALGVSYSTIADTLGGAVGSTYVNDFPRDGRLQQVIVQAQPSSRMQVDDVLNLHVRNEAGKMVRLSEIITPEWSTMPLQFTRYNGYPSTSISGSAASGVSAARRCRKWKRLAAKLPRFCGRMDRSVAARASVGLTGADVDGLFVPDRFPGPRCALRKLDRAAVRYDGRAAWHSWCRHRRPLRGLENDVFFKVGLITLIGCRQKMLC